MKIIETERLILRTWKDEDIDPYFKINQDSKVIKYLAGSMTYDQIQEFFQRCNQEFNENKFCFFAAELKSSKELIGMVGLAKPRFESHFTPCVEIGWRLGSQFWGKGYATEGAKAVIDYGFNVIGLDEIVSFTVPMNSNSINVMKRLGMERDVNGDFNHTKLPLDNPLSRHILYRIKNSNQTNLDIKSLMFSRTNVK